MSQVDQQDEPEHWQTGSSCASLLRGSKASLTLSEFGHLSLESPAPGCVGYPSSFRQASPSFRVGRSGRPLYLYVTLKWSSPIRYMIEA
jgi:hypothetical protein